MDKPIYQKCADCLIKKMIELKAYEKYEYRRDNGMALIADQLGNLREITPQDDWLEAEAEILEKFANRNL